MKAPCSIAASGFRRFGGRRDIPNELTGRPRDGMTLVEVLLAVFILGVSIAGLMSAISQCATSFSIARRTQALHSVLDQAEIIHPMIYDKEPVDELAVAEDSGIVDGYTFTRECEEDEDEDGLYVVTSTVRAKSGGWGSSLKVVRYVYCAETRKK